MCICLEVKLLPIGKGLRPIGDTLWVHSSSLQIKKAFELALYGQVCLGEEGQVYQACPLPCLPPSCCD